MKPGRPGHQDDILLRLLRGPALASELPHGKTLHQQISALNKTLKHAGRHIDSRPVKCKGRLGLTIVDREYRLVKIAAAFLFVALIAPALAGSMPADKSRPAEGMQRVWCERRVDSIANHPDADAAIADFMGWVNATKGWSNAQDPKYVNMYLDFIPVLYEEGRAAAVERCVNYVLGEEA